ncbi:MAG: hypothetical protein ACUZ8H_05255 [Candidatus Anammoxibacter sp.]
MKFEIEISEDQVEDIIEHQIYLKYKFLKDCGLRCIGVGKCGGALLVPDTELENYEINLENTQDILCYTLNITDLIKDITEDLKNYYVFEGQDDYKNELAKELRKAASILESLPSRDPEKARGES